MTGNTISLDKNIYDSLQQELTELRQAVAANSANEQRQNLFIEYMPVAIAIFDRQMCYRQTSRRWREEYGLLNQEIIGLSIYEIFPETERWREVHQHCLAGNIAKCEEEVFPRTDGTIDWVRWEIHPWYEDSGSVGGIILFAEVITARKQVEAALKTLNEELEARVEERTSALRQSEARFQRLADNVPGMLYEFRLQPDGTMLFPYVSSGSRDVLGIEPEQMQADALFAFSHIHPEDISSVQAAIADSAQTLQDFEYEWQFSTPSGQQRWAKAMSRPERQGDGETVWYGCLFDISDAYRQAMQRKQAEAKFQEQAQFLQSIWEGVDYGIYVLDVLDNGAEFRFLNFNPTILKLSPMPLEPLLGKTLAEGLPDDMANLYRQYYRECVNSGKTMLFEESFFANNQETWWQINVTPLRDSTSQISQLIITVTDITERKKIEKERQMFVSLVENSNDFIGVANLESQTLYINNAGLDLLGIDSLAIAQGMKSIDFIPPEYRDDLQQRVFPTVLECGAWQAEYYFQHLQTREAIPVDCNIFIVNSPETGKPLFLASISRDIRERKQVEAQLQEQEQFLRIIYNGVNQLIFVVDVLEDGEVRFAGWNSPTAQATGISNTEILGKTPEEAFGDVQGAAIHQRYQNCIDAGIAVTYEECLTFENQETWWLTTINPLKNTEGRIYRLVGTTFNITPRKQAEQALQASQHFIQRITDSSPHTLYIFDIEENRNVYANKEIATLLGYSPEEIQQMGENLLPAIIHPDDWVKVEAQLQKFTTAQDGDIFEIEFRVRSGNGEWCWLYSRETPFMRNAEGAVKQVLGVSTDITERKQAEIQLQQQTQNLENTLYELQRTQAQLIQSEKMSSIGNMVAGIAHEINNPVNFIHGNLIPASEYTQDLLRLIKLYQQHYPIPPAEIVEEIADIDLEFIQEDLIKLLQSMRVGTQRIREIVLSLRNFSRLDEAEVKDVNIHEGIDSTLMILQNRLKAKPDHPEILVIKEYGKLPLIECYPGQLNQVFMNILSNAIDVLDESCRGEQGQILIRTEVLNHHWIAIRISDNGFGITQANLAKLFDPFFTTKDVGKGTGLGLSISYQIIVDKHHGKLSCNSKPGQGAEFMIEIPVSQ